jgi:hypothetical protein
MAGLKPVALSTVPSSLARIIQARIVTDQVNS